MTSHHLELAAPVIVTPDYQLFAERHSTPQQPDIYEIPQFPIDVDENSLVLSSLSQSVKEATGIVIETGEELDLLEMTADDVSTRLHIVRAALVSDVSGLNTNRFTYVRLNKPVSGWTYGFGGIAELIRTGINNGQYKIT